MRTTRRRPLLAAAAVLALSLGACGTEEGGGATGEQSGAPTPRPTPRPTTASTSPGSTDEPTPVDDGGEARAGRIPLRKGERRVAVRLPEPYSPSAPTGSGTDDYRCFLLDPGVTSDQFITGFDVRPDNPDVVHHVILFRVPADLVDEAERTDVETPGQGWTCFGGSGLVGDGVTLEDAPWLGAWAPGGDEQVYPRGFGEELGKGSRVVMQVHYNLAAGSSPDRSAAELRLAPASGRIKALETSLLPAPVELPCRAAYDDGGLCDRGAALLDVKKRFGEGPGSTADLLHLLCGEIRPGPVQKCTRTVQRPETVRAVAGHMHLLGRSLKVRANPGTPEERTLLDIPVWDFDDQGSRSVKPLRLRPGDTVEVTCRHSQELRDLLPAFEGQPDRYVLWGEGTTDEMCLAILLVTRP